MEPERSPPILRDFELRLGFIDGVKKGTLVLIGLLVLVVVAGYWIGSKTLLAELGRTVAQDQAGAGQAPDSRMFTTRAPAGARTMIAPDQQALAAGGLQDQRVLMFADRESMAAFVERHGAEITVLGRIDALNAVRVGTPDVAGWMERLGLEDQDAMIFPVSVPILEDGQAQPGAVALGDRLLDWLGVSRANPQWGAGVKVAVLDTGVVPGESLGVVSQLIELVPSSNDLSMHNGHATAVASMISSRSADAPGVAPAAEIVSVRVADDRGLSDTFLLARGIVEAVEAGADLINISLGGFNDSGLLREAVDYAIANGVLVLASVGNQGVDRVQYPAAIDGVIGVGAVDALGSHLDFSNRGTEVDIAAPGFGVRSQWTDGQVVEVSGTSFSSPIVAGVLAALMTHGSSERITAAGAWDLMTGFLNDGAVAGADDQLGQGMPDLGRVLLRDSRGIHDAALASMTLLSADVTHPYGQIEVLVQNRGTEPLVNTWLRIETNGLMNRVNLTALEPGEVQSVLIPVSRPLQAGTGSLSVVSSVALGNGQVDAKPANNYRQVTYTGDDGT